MTHRPEDLGKLRGYLLGGLSEEESAELERRYFDEDALFEELLAEETEILDAYASGALPDDERVRLEKLLETSPRLRKRSALAKSMLRLDKRPGRRVPLAALLLAAGIVLAVGTLWVVRTPRQRSPAGEVAVHRETAVPVFTPPPAAETPFPVAVSRTPAARRPDAAIVSFVLAAGVTRNASNPTLVSIPRGTAAVELHLPLEADEHSAYSVSLQSAAGAEILTRSGLRSREGDGIRIVVLEVPAGSLPAGDYLVTLSGENRGDPTEALGQYAFRVSHD